MKRLIILVMSYLTPFSASCGGVSVGLHGPYPGYDYDDGYWGDWDDRDDKDFGDDDFNEDEREDDPILLRQFRP